MQKNGRQTHGLVYIRNGEACFYLKNGKVHKATNGQLLYLPKAAEYQMQYTADKTTFVVINFDLQENGTNPFPANDITVLMRDDSSNAVASIMAKFELCGSSQNPAGQFRKKELFYRLLSLIYDRLPHTQDQCCPKIVKGVILLKQTYLENLPIEVFAKQSHVSLSTFRQLFRKQYGMSPIQYRNRLRIERAKQLLEYDDCTVAEAAYASGFENLGYFCRCYKKITKETPKKAKSMI